MGLCGAMGLGAAARLFAGHAYPDRHPDSRPIPDPEPKQVTLLREYADRKCFDFQQRLLRADGAELARVRVLMCCVDPAKEELTAVPPESWEEWTVRMRERGTLMGSSTMLPVREGA